MKTISRVYDSYAQARAAVSAVEAAGVPTSEVSLVANKYVSADYVDVDDVSKSAVGLGIGGVVGGGTGLLAGLGMLAIPGLGPVVAAGWLAAAAVVAVAGATAGGQGREPINLPGGRVVRVRYAPIATKFRGAAK